MLCRCERQQAHGVGPRIVAVAVPELPFPSGRGRSKSTPKLFCSTITSLQEPDVPPNLLVRTGLLSISISLPLPAPRDLDLCLLPLPAPASSMMSLVSSRPPTTWRLLLRAMMAAMKVTRTQAATSMPKAQE